MSRLSRMLLVSAAALVAAASPALAASKKGGCAPGKTAYAGKCVTACPTEGRFDPATCECPKGWSKLMAGGGLGECRRVMCTLDRAIKDPSGCECPRAYEQQKVGKETRCVLVKEKLTGIPDAPKAAAATPAR